MSDIAAADDDERLTRLQILITAKIHPKCKEFYIQEKQRKKKM